MPWVAMTILDRPLNCSSTRATGMKEAEIRKRAFQHGLAVRFHNGGYMIVDRYGAMLAGEDFTLTLDDVEDFLRQWNIKKVQQQLRK